MQRIATIIPTLEIGGAENLVVSLLKNYNYDDLEMYLIVLFDEGRNLYNDKLCDLPIQIIYMNKKNGLDISLFFKLRKTLNKINPSIIHTHLYSSSYVILWRLFNKNRKWYHTVHNVADKELYSFHLNFMRFSYKHKLVEPIAISRIVCDSLFDYYHIDKNSIHIIYNGVGISDFDLANRIYLKNNKINLITVSRLTSVKNQIMLLRVLNKINVRNSFSLTIVGDGDQRDNLENYIENNNMKNVKFVGAVKNVSYYLNEHDLFVLSSTYEGLPISILEAMAAGLPIVASNVGGIPDIVKDNVNGYLFEPDNDEQLITILKKYEYNKNLIKEQGFHNKEECQKYDIKKIAKQYEELFKYGYK